MHAFDPASYGPVWSRWLDVDRCRPLGGGTPPPEVAEALEHCSPASAFAPHAVGDRALARCCLAGVWLLYDALDESHAISQQIEVAEGSFWHGVMHRREGDFGNAKYWFRRVGDHPVWAALGEALRELSAHDPPPKLPPGLAGGEFDPYAFVDLCAAASRGSGAATAFCRRLQQAEWELLFDHCYRGALSISAS